MRTKQRGFTLIELLVTIAIVAILALIAIYVFSSQVSKSRRSDGINSLLSISLAEERYRSTNTQYGTLTQVWGSTTTSAEGYYTLSVSNVSATSYTITATAQGSQANDSENGTSCATLTLAVSNGTITKTPSVCWPT